MTDLKPCPDNLPEGFPWDAETRKWLVDILVFQASHYEDIDTKRNEAARQLADWLESIEDNDDE